MSKLFTCSRRGPIGSAYVFTENTVVFDSVRESDTYWLYESQLDPETYYVHVKGWDDSCLRPPYEGECGSAWSDVLTLVIPSPPPRYAAKVASIWKGAIRVPGSTKTWTYMGDAIRRPFSAGRVP